MFDDEIVCLGSGINSSDDRTIETIVENRVLKDDNSNVLTIDGEEVKKTEYEIDNKSMKWAHLTGNVDNAEVGYYFPNAQNINIKRTQNTGYWKEIGPSDLLDSFNKPIEITKKYLEMWFDHGTNPQNKTYEYVLLPNKSKEEVKAYSENPQIIILNNDANVQAVKETNTNIIGANFWTDTVQNVDGITCNKKASVMTKEANGYIEVAVSDPTMKNDGIIEIEINKEGSVELLKDKSITITQLSPTIKFSVNVKNSKGKTFNAKFKLKQGEENIEELKVETNTNLTSLKPNEKFIASTCVNNKGEVEKSVLTMTVLYDSNNKVANINHESKTIRNGESDIITTSLILPNNVNGHKIKVFVWEGKDIETSKIKILAPEIEIK